MFLDELQIPHQNGVIADDSTAVPSADALRAAADHLRAAFPAEDVQFYLSALLASDAVAWANLGAAFTDAALTDEETLNRPLKGTIDKHDPMSRKAGRIESSWTCS
jgi:hypothetical protein